MPICTNLVLSEGGLMGKIKYVPHKRSLSKEDRKLTSSARRTKGDKIREERRIGNE